MSDILQEFKDAFEQYDHAKADYARMVKEASSMISASPMTIDIGTQAKDMSIGVVYTGKSEARDECCPDCPHFYTCNSETDD